MDQTDMQQSAEALCRCCHARMLHRALQLVGNLPDAEDVVSACWLTLLPRASQLMGMDEPARHAYLMKCVHSRAMDLLRLRQRAAPVAQLPLCLPDPAPTPDQCALRRDALNQLLAMLPPRERSVLQLRLLGCSTTDIARQLHISASSVRGAMLRVRRRARDEHR